MTLRALTTLMTLMTLMTLKSLKNYTSPKLGEVLRSSGGVCLTFDQADACSKMLLLGIVCKQPLPSLTRICDVRRILN